MYLIQDSLGQLIKRPKNKGTKIFARSCFLQGILSFNKNHQNIAGIKISLNKWKNWCDLRK